MPFDFLSLEHVEALKLHEQFYIFQDSRLLAGIERIKLDFAQILAFKVT